RDVRSSPPVRCSRSCISRTVARRKTLTLPVWNYRAITVPYKSYWLKPYPENANNLIIYLQNLSAMMKKSLPTLFAPPPVVFKKF
ncbi:MAG: hypothetical protein KDD04_11280, partial [Sinomicrobium sp.]|nr:hypothetical protein [Sinomicrobium sp.]